MKQSENCFKVPEDGVGTAQEQVSAEAAGQVSGAHPPTVSTSTQV